MITPEIKVRPIEEENENPLRLSNYPLHGGNRKAASLLTGLREESFIDFSAGINPLGPPESVQKLLGTLLPDLMEYPDPDSSELKETLSSVLKVDQECFTITNGSTELIYILPALFGKGKSALLLQPCFSEYARALELASVPVTEINLEASKGFSVEIETFLIQISRMKNLGGIFIGHPNSPTGNLWKKEDLISLLNFCEKKEIYLIIDETFLEFAEPGYSLLDQRINSRFLILIRSMTKFYALPGVRLGYGIMSPETVKRLEAHRPPWSVNVVAQKLGNAALSDRNYPQQVRDYVRQEKNYLYQNLNNINALDVFPSDANFILFCLNKNSENDADQLYRYLLRNRILVRNCGNFSGLSPCYFRVAVKKRTENDILVSYLEEYFTQYPG